MNLNTAYERMKEFSFLERRFRLDTLDRPLRFYAVQLLAVAFVASGLIILFGLGLYPFEATYEMPEDLNSITIPYSLILIVTLGFGVVAGCLTTISYRQHTRWAFVTRLLVALLALALPLSFFQYSAILRDAWGVMGWLQFAIILLAIGSGLGAVILAFFPSARVASFAPALVSGAFYGATLAFLFFGRWWNIGQIQTETANTIFFYLLLSRFVHYMTPLVQLMGVIFFWQALTEAKLFTRDIGLRVARFADEIAWALTALFTVKIAILVAGYWRAIQGTAGEPWLKSVQDGPLAWLLAALFAVALAWWLTHWERPVKTTPSARVTMFFTAGFLLPFILAFILFIPVSVLAGVGLDASSSLGGISVLLAGVGETWTKVFAALLLPLGLVCRRSPRYRFLAPIFLLTGIWALPKILQFLSLDILSSDVDPAFEYLTFDALLTFALLAVAIQLWRGGKSRANVWTVALVLVVSSLVALAGSLIPAGQVFLAFAILLVLPLFYEIFFDAEEMNAAARTQSPAVIRKLGFQAALMVVVAWAVVTGSMSPDRYALEQVADKIFLPPLLMLILAAVITHRGAMPPDQPEEPVGQVVGE